MARHLLPGATLGPVRLDAEELLLVVPLEEGARLVESLVALQADELGVEHLREHLPELGLSRPGRSLGKERLLEREGEEECRLHAARGDVARGTQPLADLLEGDLHPAPRSLSNARRQDAAYLRAVSTERNGWTRCGSHVPLPTPLHAPGSRETVLVGSGTLAVLIDDERYDLSPGDAITFDADLPHHFENPGSTETTFTAVVTAGLRNT